jgi:hypothetical protein
MAPRPKLEDPRVRERILREVRYGVPPPIAAQAAGVSDRTYYRWIARGRDSRSGAAYEFWHQVLEARAVAISAAQLTLTNAALGRAVRREVRRVVMNEDGVDEEVIEREFHPPHVGALQWFLERRVPEYYGAVVARDADASDTDEVIPPAAADEDASTLHADLASLADRAAARATAGEGGPGSLPPPRGD